jgi:hypothetical protein
MIYLLDFFAIDYTIVGTYTRVIVLLKLGTTFFLILYFIQIELNLFVVLICRSEEFTTKTFQNE